MTDWCEFKKGYVYFIAEAIPYHETSEPYRTRDGEYYVKYVKIGWTDNTPEQRLKALQTSSPRELFVLGSVHTHREAEGMIHKVLDYGRVRGEWFDFQAIGEHLAMWVPVWDYYNLDSNILNVDRYDFKDTIQKEKKHFEISDAFNDIINYYPKTNSGSLLRPTTARKMHFDIIGNMINIGDTYYQISNSSTFGDNVKLSESTLSIFFELCKRFNLVDIMNEISSHAKRSYGRIYQDTFMDDMAKQLFKP